jgi:hypothetical protein
MVAPVKIMEGCTAITILSITLGICRNITRRCGHDGARVGANGTSSSGSSSLSMTAKGRGSLFEKLVGGGQVVIAQG